MKLRGPITPTTGAWDDISDEDRECILALSQACQTYLGQGNTAGAVRLIEDRVLSVEHYIALWTTFNSKQRSAMKKV